ncbi:MAG: PTS transporter subunit EIIA [Oligosphaeraceae bacterium]|nr:PTS transporter subunit EIIA [Oligosphaeraceae bacterium]
MDTIEPIHVPDQQLIAACAGDEDNLPALDWCGQVLAEKSVGEYKMLRLPEETAEIDALGEQHADLLQLDPDLILSDWPNGIKGTTWLNFVQTHNFPVVFLRWPQFRKIRRVLILSSGGIHVMRLLWIAQQTAEAYGCPALVLQVLRDQAADEEASTESTRLQARMLGMDAPLKLVYSNDVISGIENELREDDLIVLGAPNHWRLKELFPSSLPERIAAKVANPMMMLLGKKPAKLQLREVFWPHMINLNLHSVSYEEAIGQLLDCLIVNEQIPANWHERLLQQALAREQVCSTYVGGETAFPHITMPIQSGMAGCLGIFPQGVDFAASDKSLSKFVFLFITPDFYYSDYLDILAYIAEKMSCKETRRRLLLCSNAEQVLDILEPLKK